jgi:plasmid rolling circle replication initiator protein Rep
MNHTIRNEILQDIRLDGKERPWREKKIKTVKVADCFARLGMTKRGKKIRFCGTLLEFINKILTKANFCKDRLCSMCNWRRSLRLGYVLSTVLDAAEKENKGLVLVFLTLTLRNCRANAADLTATFNQIFKGWDSFTHRKKIKGVIKGWFRSVELTYNRERNEFHPHVHVILCLEKSYFAGSAYINHAELRRLWGASLGVNYLPICRVAKVTNTGSRRQHILEIAKYTVKDTDFIFEGNDKLTDKIVGILAKSLHKRRLVAFGGILKEIASRLKFSGDDKEDLIDICDGTIREDVAQLIERYQWCFNISQYVKVKEW